MFVIIGLVLAFVLILIFSNTRTRQCRWREDRTRDTDGERYYHCMNCGHEAWTDTGKPPGICLATARGK
ncbi:hypothetical protein [Roseovarius nanhaiticus]|uniref:Uncharacterized protein n=1 Tax=Roseovarius nanhaiticus TaxID=573024 RepID=A0A1N7FFB7_9RHOB|nr:hypothetical protein [Roseovarius nanhaiticus]SEK55997.1 hypothetical protein SAMN05216208_1154 [Roseovarius nanhaiticus]SIR98916.1 hypothetical protein SAMN05421666_0982 [Roseovarius nanhaiticus]